jgi:hypothetical protein
MLFMGQYGNTYVHDLLQIIQHGTQCSLSLYCVKIEQFMTVREQCEELLRIRMQCHGFEAA